MKTINYLSDFDLIVHIKTCEGTDIGFPAYDFKLFFYTTSKMSGFTASCIGGKCTNLFNDNGQIHVVFDNHKLGSGELRVVFTALLPNGLYPDGDKKLVIPQALDIKLVQDKGDCTKNIDAEVVVPYVYISAYDLAQSAGYTGTLEEYTQAINELPTITEEAKNLNAILSDIAEGKREIAEAVSKWIPEVTEQTSYKEMAERILDLPVKPKDFADEYPETLLGFLKANERKDYPYMWGVEFLPTEEEENELKLTGADAYLLDDGTFYEGDATHKFEDNWAHQTRRVIYYHKQKEYTVFAPFLYNVKIIPYSGEPDYLLTDGSKFVLSLESVIDKPYLIGENRQYNFNSNNIFEIILRGLQGSETQCILVGGSYKIIAFPDLEIMNSNFNAANTNQTSTFYTKYPSLKKLISGCLYGNYFKGDKIYLPLLEIVYGGGIASNCSALSEISLPLLESVSGGTLVNNCPIISEISLPLLESVSGSATLLSNLSSITEFELPNLKSVTTSQRFIQNFTSLKKFSALKLIDIRLSSVNMFEGCNVLDDITFGEGCVYNQAQPILPSTTTIKKALIKGLAQFANGGVLNNNSTLTEVELPNLETITGGTVFNSCSALTDVELPNLETITGGTVFNSCSALTDVELPNLETWTSPNNGQSILINCNGIEVVNFPKLEVASTNQAQTALVGFNSSSNRKYDIVINLPALRDTRAILSNGVYSQFFYPISGLGGNLTGHTFSINLGAPQGGYIYIKEAWCRSILTSITVQPGFRSYLKIDEFTEFSKEVLENIITNLGDNSEHEPLQIVFGATNLAKISDEKKLEATNKNYTLS